MKTKIDCSIAENYIMERNRIPDEGIAILNKIFDAETDGNPKLAIEIVQNWSDEHPVEKVVTYLDKLLEVFPNMPLKNDKVPRIICPIDLGLEEIGECGVNGMAPCARCWNQPYKENSNG